MGKVEPIGPNNNPEISRFHIDTRYSYFLLYFEPSKVGSEITTNWDHTESKKISPNNRTTCLVINTYLENNRVEFQRQNHVVHNNTLYKKVAKFKVKGYVLRTSTTIKRSNFRFRSFVVVTLSDMKHYVQATLNHDTPMLLSCRSVVMSFLINDCL